MYSDTIRTLTVLASLASDFYWHSTWAWRKNCEKTL